MDPNLQNGEFKKVSYKKRGKPSNSVIKGLNQLLEIIDESFNLDLNIRRIKEAKEELHSADLYQSVTALLKEGIGHLNNPKISKIISLGLGRIHDSTIARYQFALLLCLRDLTDADIVASDPVFNKHDISILEYFDVVVDKNNQEGKYCVKEEVVLFYLPHCPKQLTNNLLWSNWGLHLSNCIIICNSINKIVEDNTKKDLTRCAYFLNQICPYVCELGVVNSFRLFEVFNDTSIHVFPIDKLKLLGVDFWNVFAEPVYSDNDIEFVKGANK
ncbi:SRR1-like protein [Anthonomus grandis grandis]|uniref:SRR1-like protein n=1 Tax=Anthonomus grandis grandis TaxID=2921223 RepID=UPI0021652B0B|nr:SRR1-like protein [Anthonomus grandis grandis]